MHQSYERATVVALSQRSVNTAGLVGVSAVSAGTVIIILIIWVALCYNLYKDERDFCKFKKVKPLVL